MSVEKNPTLQDDDLYQTLKEGLMDVFKGNVEENKSDRRHGRDSTSGIAAAEAARALIELEKLRLGIK